MSRRRIREIPISYPVRTGKYESYRKMSSTSDWVKQTEGVLDINQATFNRLWSDIEITIDETHKGPPFHSGGPFLNLKVKDPSLQLQNVDHYECVYPDILSLGNGLDYSNVWPKYKHIYDGGFATNAGPLTSLSNMRSELASAWTANGLVDVTSYGPTGWKRYQPLKPTVDLGQTVYELRELPRMLMTTSKGFADIWRSLGGNRSIFGPKKLADHWLNIQFGWKPFLSDMAKLYNFQKKLAAKYRYLVNANGKWKKRGGKITSQNDTVYASWSPSAHYTPGLSSAFTSYGSARARTRVYNTTKLDVWFEGSFRFWIPDLGSYDEWKTDYISHLGLNISPSLVYNLTPWTWLIDWFTNLGDVIDNYSTQTGQCAAKYAYVMGHSQRFTKVDSFLPFAGQDLMATWEFPIERKQRVEANPFGFGLNWDSLTPVQWSILGALGLSKQKLL